VIGKLLDDTTMNSSYFIKNILFYLKEKFFRVGSRPHTKRLVIHMDNCSVHNCDMTTNFLAKHNMSRVSQPPYSPDLAPNDFYLFPTMKENLKDFEMVDEHDLFYRMQEILSGISINELNKVFTAWIKRVEEGITRNGSYIS
jgi:histone-lysine N-methyltransferase SETMAR